MSDSGDHSCAYGDATRVGSSEADDKLDDSDSTNDAELELESD